MSVEAAYDPDEFVSDGSLTARSIPWPFIDADNLVVTVDGAARVLNDDFEVSGAYPSAELVPLSGFATNGQAVTIARTTPPVQSYEIVGQSLDRAALELALDRIALVAQENAEAAGRALKLGHGETAALVDTPVASRVLAFVDGRFQWVANGAAEFEAEAAAAMDALEALADLVTAELATLGDIRDDTVAAADAAAAALAVLLSAGSIAASVPAANWAAGLAAVSNGQTFYLTRDGRRYYYLRVSSTIADLYQVTWTDPERQAYAVAAAGGDAETAPAGLDVDFASADALTRPGAVPNRAKGSPSLNLLASNRPSDAGLWDALLTNNVTLTRNRPAVLGSGSKAYRVVYAGSGFSASFAQIFIPAGRWSLVMSVSCPSGTAPFRVSLDGGATFGSLTATTTPTRYVAKTQVFTTGAVQNVYFYTEAASPAALSIDIDDMYLIPGDGSSVPAQVLGIQPLSNTVYQANAGIIKSGPVVASSPLHMVAPLGSQVTVTSFFVTVAFKRTGAPGNNLLWSLTDSADFLGDQPAAECLSVFLSTPLLQKFYNEVNLPLNEFIILGLNHTGTELQLYVDGVLFARTAHALTAVNSYGHSLFGFKNDNGYNADGEGASFQGRLNATATGGEMANMARVARQRIVSAGGSYRGCNVVPIFCGDSITASFNATRGYPNRVVTSYTPYLQGGNFATIGHTFAQVLARLYTEVIPMCMRVKAAGKTPLVILHAGTNDVGAYSDSSGAATTASNAAAAALPGNMATQWFDPLTARDIPAFASTLMDNAALTPANQTRRATINTGIRALTARYSGLIDFAANANLNTNNVTYFADAAHPNDVGTALMATIATPVLDPFVALYR